MCIYEIPNAKMKTVIFRVLIAEESVDQHLLFAEARRGSWPKAGAIVFAIMGDYFCLRINGVSIFSNANSRS